MNVQKNLDPNKGVENDLGLILSLKVVGSDWFWLVGDKFEFRSIDLCLVFTKVINLLFKILYPRRK